MAVGNAAADTGARGRPIVQFEGVTKRFGAFTAVDAVSLAIHEREFFALLGPSGCGKTTLLRMLAGFEQPSEGRILLDGADIVPVPPHRRPLNMMFQSYALFPHLSVEGNIAFGLKQEALPKAEIAARVAEMLALVKLEALARRRPDQLSGGQRQRVALARALAKRPRVLLLDEPLGALDRKLREETRVELVALQKRLGLTFIVVTHDQEEAMSVADRIAVMEAGRLIQVAPPAEVYEQPNSRWIASFIGDVNLIEGRVVAPGPDGTAIDTPELGRLQAAQASEVAPGTTAWLAVRPEKLWISREQPEPGNRACGSIADIAYLGGVSIVSVRLDGGAIMKATVTNVARLPMQPLAAGERVWLAFAPDAAVVLTR